MSGPIMQNVYNHVPFASTWRIQLYCKPYKFACTIKGSKIANHNNDNKSHSRVSCIISQRMVSFNMNQQNLCINNAQSW